MEVALCDAMWLESWAVALLHQQLWAAAVNKEAAAVSHVKEGLAAMRSTPQESFGIKAVLHSEREWRCPCLV